MSRLSPNIEYLVELILIADNYYTLTEREQVLRAKAEKHGQSIILREPKGESKYEDILIELAEISREQGLFRKIFEALPPEDKTFVALRYGGGFTIPELARIFGISRSTAYRLRRKILARGAEILGWSA